MGAVIHLFPALSNRAVCGAAMNERKPIEIIMPHDDPRSCKACLAKRREMPPGNVPTPMLLDEGGRP